MQTVVRHNYGDPKKSIEDKEQKEDLECSNQTRGKSKISEGFSVSSKIAPIYLSLRAKKAADQLQHLIGKLMELPC